MINAVYFDLFFTLEKTGESRKRIMAYADYHIKNFRELLDHID